MFSCIIIIFGFSLWATFFIYEPDIGDTYSFNHPFYIFIVMFLPTTSIVVAFITTTKFIIDAILKKQGARLRLTIVLIIIALISIPGIVITYVSVNIITSNLKITLHDSTEKSLFTLIDYSHDKIENQKNDMERILSFVSTRYLQRLTLYESVLNRDTYFTNITVVSNIYMPIEGDSLSTNAVVVLKGIDSTIDIRQHFTNTNTVFINSEYYNKFYVTAIIPILPYEEVSNRVSYYGIWTESMPDNFIEERNNVLEAIRLYKSIDIFTNEYSTLLLLLYIFMLGISLFFALIFAIILSRLITSPIGIILNASNAITSGNFDISLKIRGMSDMRTLMHQFNIMARSLKHNKTLETKRAKLETWREVSLTVAHEIKNPLTPIIMNTELIEMKVKESMSAKEIENIKSYSNIIKNNAYIILSLVKSFSKYSFNANMSNEKISVNDVVKEVVMSFENYDNINLNSSFTKYDYMMKMDRERLVMSIVNIIKNSVEAIESKESGHIYVSTYNKIVSEQEYFVITITDTGIGLSEYNINKVFEPYYTSKAKGTGLGLPIVEKIISEHNGTITLESKESEGTTFFIVFARNDD